MVIFPTDLSCPKCGCICKTKGVSLIVLIIVSIIAFFTIIGIIFWTAYLLVTWNQTVECPQCGFKWKP